MTKRKVWDIVQPRDDWEQGYARLEYLRIGLVSLWGKKIRISYED